MLTLRSNCGQCAALCCVALAFDRSDLFGYDKPAGEACRHLDDCGGCRIYGNREESGFAGCSRFECFGAGQFVTQSLFFGRSWQVDSSLKSPMMEAFFIIKRAFEILDSLDTARRMDLSADKRRELEELIGEFGSEELWRDEASRQKSVVRLEAEGRRFLRSLAPWAKQFLLEKAGENPNGHVPPVHPPAP